MGKNVILFGTDMCSSVHNDNKNKDISILSEGPTLGLDDTTLTSEAKYYINFTQSGKRFVPSIHYIRSNSFLLLVQKDMNSKHKRLWSKRLYTEFRCHFKIFYNKYYDKNKIKRKFKIFSVDFNSIGTNDNLDIF